MSATVTAAPLAERYTAAFPKSRALYEKAKSVFPAGVTHELRDILATQAMTACSNQLPGGRRY